MLRYYRLGGGPIERSLHLLRLHHRELRRLQSGDDRRRVHGRFRSSRPQWERSRSRDRPDVTSALTGRHSFQDSASAQRAAQTEDRSPFGSLRRRRRRPQNASLLPLRRHRQHRLPNGIQRLT